MEHTDAEVAFSAVSPVGSAEAHMSMTADQQIRAKALECALQYRAIFKTDLEEHGFTRNDKFCDRVFNEQLVKFERYIREGK